MIDVSLEEIEFIKILANSDASALSAGITDETLYRLANQIGMALREYYNEKTLNKKGNITEKFEEAGITEDDGKAALACARRLGVEIF